MPSYLTPLRERGWASYCFLRSHFQSLFRAHIRAYVAELDRIESLAGEFKPRVIEFLERLEPREASEQLYAFLDADERLADAAATFIKAAKLRDLAEIRRHMAGESQAARRRALELLAAGQQVYAPEDVGHLRRIAVSLSDSSHPL